VSYASLRDCLDDLERNGELVRIEEEIDPYLEAASIQRRVYAAKGPALYFSRVKGTRFPLASNLFGTKKRAEWIFRDALKDVRSLVSARVDPVSLAMRPTDLLRLPRAAVHLLPRSVKTGPALERSCALSDVPKITSWPKDGGPFVLLPQVYTEDPDAPGFLRSNLGMYRIQLGGNDYASDEVGLHYQIHRGIGVHHAAAVRRKEKLRVSIFVGGPPAMTLAAVMPLPEGMPEIAFAGVLNQRSIRLVRDDRGVVHADADFCIRGWVDPLETKREGPFGDHLGYYSLAHDFPVLHVQSVTHRADAVWPFTVVGRPPQEDTTLGALIHELTAPLVPKVMPGVKAIHAVDAAGVHPLLLAIGSERYVPWSKERRPMETITQALGLLGQGQTSLAKYLFIAAHEDSPPDVRDVAAFLAHVLERTDPMRDWHFLGNTTIDTLDYSGSGLNMGSKVIVCGVGAKRRTLARKGPIPGVLCVKSASEPIPEGFPLVIVCDDPEFASRTLDNLLWVTFTRSNPASDVSGVGEFVRDKSWGCTGSVIIDARRKPHHAPVLEEDPGVERRVDRLFQRGGPLARWG
jgi:4-hydroxy-3-polyprenylbenzoate decarboxylase